MTKEPVQPEEHQDGEAASFFDDAETPENRLPVRSQLLVVAIVLLIIFGTGYLPKLVAYFSEDGTQSATVPLSNTNREPERSPAKDELETSKTNAFESLTVTADAAFVWDVAKQRVLYEKNPDQQLPLASITKLMTALVAHEILLKENTIPISLSAILQDGESGFSDGERFALQDLTDLTLMNSSNDGAFALAATAGALLDPDDPATTFIKAMNIRAEELDLTQTYFRNPTGLDISETEAGAFGSARDVAFLVEHILKQQPEILEQTTIRNTTIYDENGNYYEGENTNQYVDEIPGLIGSKTGYTTLAGGNLVVAFDASVNHPVVVVVLRSTHNERFRDILTLTDATRLTLE